ncbi:MAG: plasmid mobilization relaxosome protein MobC [Planctomycetaceae bacterium]|nr:plasmid mobilization relaxosome protein MobC [Planctomycetaceae bacterium]
MSRGRFLKVRVSDAELMEVRAKAFHADMTVSNFMRFRVMDYRLRRTSADKERLRQLARISNNINQLARWANTHKAAGPALEILLWLNRLAVEVMDIAHGDATEEGSGNVD